jgi:signal peptidase I
LAARKASPAKPDNVVARVRGGEAGREPDRGRRRVVWENVKSLLGAVVIYLVLKTFLIEAYRIPSGSMIPTLLIGDWLFVNKLVYGPTVPFTDARLPGYQEPRRGEVVVFKSPRQIDQPEDQQQEDRHGERELDQGLATVLSSADHLSNTTISAASSRLRRSTSACISSIAFWRSTISTSSSARRTSWRVIAFWRS